MLQICGLFWSWLSTHVSVIDNVYMHMHAHIHAPFQQCCEHGTGKRSRSVSSERSGKRDEEKERTGLLSCLIESTLNCTTPNEVLHVGEGGHPREVAWEMRCKKTREKRESMRMKGMGKWATKIACLPGPDEWGYI
jgi:hypothetical protein